MCNSELSANVTRLVFCELNCHGRKVCVWIFNFTSPVYSPKLVEHVEKYRILRARKLLILTDIKERW